MGKCHGRLSYLTGEIEAKRRNKADILANEVSHFREFANMMRPVLNPPPDLRGTAADRFVFVCRCDADTPWGIVVFVRASHLAHSVFVPVLGCEGAAVQIHVFFKRGRLQDKGQQMQV